MAPSLIVMEPLRLPEFPSVMASSSIDGNFSTGLLLNDDEIITFVPIPGTDLGYQFAGVNQSVSVAPVQL